MNAAELSACCELNASVSMQALCQKLVADSRDTSAISRLRSSAPLPCPTSCTKKFESFENFAINKYQSPL